MSIINELYDLYKNSQEKVRQEKLMQKSFLRSIIDNLDIDSELLCDTIDLYSKEPKKFEKILISKLQESFGKTITKIDNIIYGGYEKYYCDVHFTINNITYEIEIPNPPNISINNIEHAHFGMYNIGYEKSKGSWVITIQSYNTEDIKEELQRLIKIL